jgi:hypothetical protein
LEQEDWVDQITLVFNVVHVCSNFGELRLKPSLLPSELAFLEDKKNLEHAIVEQDIHIIGELCHCLRVFGLSTDTSDVLKKGIGFLLAQQNVRDGSWPTRHGEMDPYVQYHATMCATMALYEPVFRGYGPGFSDLNRLILKWNRKDKLVVDEKFGEDPIPETLTVVAGTYCAEETRGLGIVSEAAGEARLNALLRWKLVTSEQSPSDYDDVVRHSSHWKEGAGRSSAAARNRAAEMLQSSTGKSKEILVADADLVDTDDEAEEIEGI